MSPFSAFFRVSAFYVYAAGITVKGHVIGFLYYEGKLKSRQAT